MLVRHHDLIIRRAGRRLSSTIHRRHLSCSRANRDTQRDELTHGLDKGATMDDALSALTAADLVWLDIVTAQYSDDSPENVTQAFSVSNLCIPKTAGSLELVMTAKEFGYPQIHIPLRLRGTAIGVSAGLPQVRWTVDEIVNAYIPDSNIRIDSVKGQLTGVLAVHHLDDADDPIVEEAKAKCGGENHHFDVDFSVAGETAPPNELKTAVTYDPDGLAIGFTATISHVVITGSAAENLSDLSVSIRVKKRWKCWAGPVAGASELYRAVPSQVLTGEVAYHWEV